MAIMNGIYFHLNSIFGFVWTKAIQVLAITYRYQFICFMSLFGCVYFPGAGFFIVFIPIVLVFAAFLGVVNKNFISLKNFLRIGLRKSLRKSLFQNPFKFTSISHDIFACCTHRPKNLQLNIYMEHVLYID